MFVFVIFPYTISGRLKFLDFLSFFNLEESNAWQPCLEVFETVIVDGCNNLKNKVDVPPF